MISSNGENPNNRKRRIRRITPPPPPLETWLKRNIPIYSYGLSMGIVAVRPASWADQMIDQFGGAAKGNAPGLDALIKLSYPIALLLFGVYILSVLLTRPLAFRNIFGWGGLLTGLTFLIIGLRNVLGGEMPTSSIGAFAITILIVSTGGLLKIAEVLKSLLCASLLFSLLNWYQLSFGAGIWQGRAYGITAHPNHLGAYSAMYAIPIVVALMDEKDKKFRSFLAILALSVFGLAYASGSRTALLTFAGGIVGICIAKRNLTASISVIGACVLIGAGAFLYLENADKDMGVASIEQNSERGNTRDLAWKSLARAAYENPLFGEGYQTYQYVENSYLLAWTRGGVFAVAGLIAALSVSCVRGIQSSDRVGSVTILAMLFGSIVLGIFEGTLLDKFSPMTFLLAISICGADTLKVAHSTRLKSSL